MSYCSTCGKPAIGTSDEQAFYVRTGARPTHYCTEHKPFVDVERYRKFRCALSRLLVVITPKCTGSAICYNPAMARIVGISGSGGPHERVVCDWHSKVNHGEKISPLRHADDLREVMLFLGI